MCVGNKQPTLYIFFGLIASGKSTLAAAWAARQGLPYYNTDIIRKELTHSAPDAAKKAAFETGIYTREFTSRTYETMFKRAAADLAGGVSVVLDGSFQSPADRDEVKRLAESLDAAHVFVLCTCLEAEMKRRMEIRAKDPATISDGRWEIYEQQKARFHAPTELSSQELVQIDTMEPVESLVKKLQKLLKDCISESVTGK